MLIGNLRVSVQSFFVPKRRDDRSEKVVPSSVAETVRREQTQKKKKNCDPWKCNAKNARKIMQSMKV